VPLSEASWAHVPSEEDELEASVLALLLEEASSLEEEDASLKVEDDSLDAAELVVSPDWLEAVWLLDVLEVASLELLSELSLPPQADRISPSTMAAGSSLAAPCVR